MTDGLTPRMTDGTLPWNLMGEMNPPTRFARWRASQGLTVLEVADLTGLSPSMISRLERGQRSLRPLTKVIVARRLAARIQDLFGPEECPSGSEPQEELELQGEPT
jgi:transcriptional regulator with XRE-family HTH domain